MRRHWKQIVGIVLIFCCGATVGGLLTFKIVEKKIQERMNPENWSPRTLAWLDREFNLTEAQQRELQPLVDAMVADLKELQKNADAERREIFGRLLLEISPALTAQQQSDLKALMSQHAKVRLSPDSN